MSSDHVHNYTSSPPSNDSFDGFLELKVTIDITLPELKVDIILSGAARIIQQQQVPPLSLRLNELLDRINPDILRAFRNGKLTVPVMIGDHNLRLLRSLRDEAGFQDILYTEPNGNVCIGLDNRIGGHIHDLDETGTQYGFLLHFKHNVK